MTNHPKTWRYMRWCPKKATNCKECAYGCMNIAHDEGRKPVDGNDMVAAMKQLKEKGEFDEFLNYLGKHGFACGLDHTDREFFIMTLVQPACFFDLLEQWLEERNGKR
jgi:hypothetical protein